MAEVVTFTKPDADLQTPDDLAKFLSDYTEPMQVNPGAIPVQPQTAIPTGGPSVPSGEIPHESVWKGNPNYFQRGKKKGTLRPSPNPIAIGSNWNPSPAPQTITGDIISGALLITLIDLLIPLLIVALNNQFSKQKIKAELLQMNEKQKSTLAPVCDSVARQINLTGNPVVILLVSLVGIYGMNFLMIKQAQDLKKDAKDG